MGVLLCVCMGEILLVFSSVKAISRVVQFRDVDMGMFQLFAICFFALGVVFVIQGGKLASLDSQTKVSEQVAKVEGEIANLQTVRPADSSKGFDDIVQRIGKNVLPSRSLKLFLKLLLVVAQPTRSASLVTIKRAINIRQPYVEQILRGEKTWEYRGRKH